MWLAVLAIAACNLPTDAPRVLTRFLVPGDSVAVPVVGQPTTVSVQIDLSAVDESLASHARAGAIVVDVHNATNASGTINVQLTAPGALAQGTVNVGGGAGQRIPLTENDIQAMIGSNVTLTAAGTLCPAAGCGATPTPGEIVELVANVELQLELGGG